MFELSLGARLNLTWRLASEWCNCAAKPGEKDTKSEFRVCPHPLRQRSTHRAACPPKAAAGMSGSAGRPEDTDVLFQKLVGNCSAYALH